VLSEGGRKGGVGRYKKKNLKREAKPELRTIICVPYRAVVKATQVPRALRHLVSPRVSTCHNAKHLGDKENRNKGKY
jgi:hypothetical protein